MDEVSKLEDQASGQIVPWPDSPVNWGKFSWNWQDSAIRELLNQPGDIFIGAIVGNQQRYYPLFDKVFALTLSSQVLEQRLDTHEHKRTKAEKDRAKAVHEEKQARWKDQGLTLISSERPVSEVVEDILSHR